MAQSRADWSGFPLVLKELTRQGTQSDKVVFPTSMVGYAVSGSGKRTYWEGAAGKQLYTAPGMLEFIEAGTCLDKAQWEGQRGEILFVELSPQLIHRLVPERGEGFRLPTRHEIFDDNLAQLALSLWAEASSGMSLGPLYAQGLMLAMLGLLDTRYVARTAPSPREASKLSVAVRERLRALVQAELSTDLDINRMAAVAAMSPRNFTRAFKRTFGQTPHAYVVEQRIEAASRLLRGDEGRSIADVACACGFASQAHFTEAFRRKIGVPPGRWRAQR